MAESSKIPFFSIIIPIYNAENYLPECLKCILDQDFYDWEAILVDDASTDNSLSIAEDYSKSDSRIRVFKLDDNSGGAFIPRLFATKSAIGKYIVPIDADDKVSLDFLRCYHDTITLHNADLVIDEMWRLKDNDAQKILPSPHIETAEAWTGKDLIKHTLCKWEISMNGFCVRRDIYLQAYRMMEPDDQKSIFADELLSRWILFYSPKVSLSCARYYYRDNINSVTNNNLPRFIDSKILNSDRIISMTAETFGTESSTYIRALENKLYSMVGLIRLVSKQKLPSPIKSSCMKKISNTMKDFDLKELKGKTSPRYLALLRLPIPLARIALKILDPIYRKN